MFKFRCIHCDKKIAVPTEFSGKPVKCPGCGESTIVPFPSPEELEAAEEIGFSVRKASSIALASRTCKQCGAVLPPTGACIQCGFDPGESLKAAFDASLATMFAAPTETTMTWNDVSPVPNGGSSQITCVAVLTFENVPA